MLRRIRIVFEAFLCLIYVVLMMTILAMPDDLAWSSLAIIFSVPAIFYIFQYKPLIIRIMDREEHV